MCDSGIHVPSLWSEVETGVRGVPTFLISFRTRERVRLGSGEDS